MSLMNFVVTEKKKKKKKKKKTPPHWVVALLFVVGVPRTQTTLRLTHPMVGSNVACVTLSPHLTVHVLSHTQSAVLTARHSGSGGTLDFGDFGDGVCCPVMNTLRIIQYVHPPTGTPVRVLEVRVRVGLLRLEMIPT